MGRIIGKDYLPRLKEIEKKRVQASDEAKQEPRGNILAQLGFDSWSFMMGAEIGIVVVALVSWVI